MRESYFLKKSKKTDGSIGKSQNKMVLTSMKTRINDSTHLQATVPSKYLFVSRIITSSEEQPRLVVLFFTKVLKKL